MAMLSAISNHSSKLPLIFAVISPLFHCDFLATSENRRALACVIIIKGALRGTQGNSV